MEQSEFIKGGQWLKEGGCKEAHNGILSLCHINLHSILQNQLGESVTASDRTRVCVICPAGALKSWQ